MVSPSTQGGGAPPKTRICCTMRKNNLEISGFEVHEIDKFESASQHRQEYSILPQVKNPIKKQHIFQLLPCFMCTTLSFYLDTSLLFLILEFYSEFNPCTWSIMWPVHNLSQPTFANNVKCLPYNFVKRKIDDRWHIHK